MSHVDRGDFCFVHAADLHLDTPFRGLAEIAPHVAAELREASLDAFDAIVELAFERDAAFMIVAGDVYDGAERGLRAQLRFRDGLARLAAAGIPSFVVHGNHDPTEHGWSAISSWPEGVTIFPSDRVERCEVHRGGRRIATVQGISYATSATTENLALRFSRPAGDGLHVGVLHCNVQGAADGYANYSPCTIADLKATGLDYLALGHVHQRRVLAGTPGKSGWVVYPGNSQARSPRATEQEAKGAVVVYVADDAVQEVEFVACDRVRFEELPVAIDEITDLAELTDLLEELGRDRIALAAGRSVVLRVRLLGRGPIHRDLRRREVLEELLRALREASVGTSPFCWWESILDDTDAAIDLDDLRLRGDFAADLFQLATELRRSAAGVSLLESAISSAPRAIAEQARSMLTDQRRAEVMLERAAMLALDRIVDAEP